MVLFCSCSHNRLEHVGGDFTADRKVLKCESSGCHCQKYHGAKDNSDSYIYKSLSIAFVIAFVGIGAFLTISLALDFLLADYTIEKIEPLEKTFLVYENGTRVSEDNMPEQPDAILFIKTVIGLILFIMLYILGAIFIDPVFEKAKKDVINSK